MSGGNGASCAAALPGATCTPSCSSGYEYTGPIPHCALGVWTPDAVACTGCGVGCAAGYCVEDSMYGIRFLVCIGRCQFVTQNLLSQWACFLATFDLQGLRQFFPPISIE